MAVKPALSDVLGSSPLSIMERHAEACLNCVMRLGPYFEAAQGGQWGKAEKLQLEIARLEGIADDIKMDVRRNLPRGLWMSVSRPDLLELVRMQDKMANETKDIAGISLGRQLAFPSKLGKPLFKFIATVTEAAEKAVEVVVATRELSRTAFGARQVTVIMTKSVMVEKIERRSDELQSTLRAKLRQHEESISPVDAIFLYQLLTNIGDIADHAEKVSHRAQIIAAS
jgi:predicted phosphate transport protein (TIGR00153 family)